LFIQEKAYINAASSSFSFFYIALFAFYHFNLPTVIADQLLGLKCTTMLELLPGELFISIIEKVRPNREALRISG